MNKRGVATVEVALMMPIFFFFLFVFSKIFALLIVTQKMEIASYYAARRWQLESHRNVQWVGWDNSTLQASIESQIREYLGYNNPTISNFLGFEQQPTFSCQSTDVWNICTLTVQLRPIDVAWMAHIKVPTFTTVKYVPSRDRPIQFVLPGAPQ